ncbi:hypothetical protein ACW2Q0_11050 [Nocardia sp. R16R-3T]
MPRWTDRPSGLIGRTGKTAFVIPDDLIQAVKRRVGVGKQSEFVTRAIRHELMALDLATIAADAAMHGCEPDAGFEAAFDNGRAI